MLTTSLRQPEQQSDHRRRGFTLIEIMIVMSLMAFLISLMIVVMANIGSSARTKATQATLSKLSTLINQKMQAFERQVEALNEEGGDFDPDYVAGTSTDPYGARELARIAGENVNNDDFAELLKYFGKKDLHRIYFPQIFEDLETSVSHPFEPPTKLDSAAPNHRDITESSELMYYFLTKLQGFGMEPGDLDQFTVNEIKDTDLDGYPEFVDAWGNPLRFYRWPTRLIRPATTSSDRTTAGQYAVDTTIAKLYFGVLPADLASDPDDPFGILRSDEVTTVTDIGIAFEGFDFSNYTSELGDDLPLPTFNTYSMPLIVSAGEDGKLGLYEPTDTLNFGYLGQPVFDSTNTAIDPEPAYDDLSSQNLRQGGN